MSVYWGINQNSYNKRKYDCIDNGDNYVHDDVTSKRIKKNYNSKIHQQYSAKMIYRVGTRIHFTEGINNRTIEMLIRHITKIINENKKKYEDTTDKLKITYIVDSPGGSVSAVLKFVDFIGLVRKKYSYVEFTSIITGTVASAGTTMSCIADKRYMTKSACAMIHELSSGNSGMFSHLISYSKHLSNLHEILCDIYLERCKLSKDELEKLLMSETWFTAKEYLALGFIDEIV